MVISRGRRRDSHDFHADLVKKIRGYTILDIYATTLILIRIDVTAKKDSRGVMKLRYRHVRSANMLLINEMIAKKKFITAELQLLEDGVENATGEVCNRA